MSKRTKEKKKKKKKKKDKLSGDRETIKLLHKEEFPAREDILAEGNVIADGRSLGCKDGRQLLKEKLFGFRFV